MIDFSLLYEEVVQLIRQPMSSMREGVELLFRHLQSYEPELERWLEALPIEVEYLLFAEWLTAILAAKPIPPEVQALHFGLLESPHGVDLYLTGTSEWQPKILKWRGNNFYVPPGKYSPTNLFTQIVKRFGVYAHLWMYLSLGLVIIFVRRYVTEEREFLVQGERSSLFCTTGFDEGDLFVIGEITAAGFVSC